jgi:hypothetical protein
VNLLWKFELEILHGGLRDTIVSFYSSNILGKADSLFDAEP